MKRIRWIDFGKGFTIFFVLTAHCIDELYGTNIFPKYDVFSKLMLAIIYTFIMPCFFALSGFLYKSPKSNKGYLYSIRKKFVNFSIPYIVFSILYVSLQHLTKVNRLNPWGSLIFIYKQPISYLWFLYVLFLIFVFIGLMDIIKVPFNIQLVLSIILFIVVQLINPVYFIYATFSWLPCFYMGILIKRNMNILNNYMVFVISLIITIFGLAIRIYLGGSWFRNNDMLMNTAIFKVGSIFLMFFFFYHVQNNKFFEYFEKYGNYSIVIYLVHLPLTSFF
ncbi:acyltransferase family protein [Companilactobacillus bobalius]|uniref:Acyltransferase 3 domain-containing protein n=2 Tax=Companilactobacillus bobalius TaxID=2801451 RepID=A0A202F9I2_9LACO|nr:acyltransferase [Companilactobacillus bobalius]KAE9557496.1 hypothetical protein ATN92_15100 [Companilactobacillus bobalius]KAE9561567.1 hypothetical protein ATN92_05655 [Companilactobacillus bobalius]KAE9563643.1 hypothetical protein ATN92_02585 [Companilactobacillus bobalius]KRK82465.1 membrane protein [Companilactobacillus bobalius DSM 19674]OVE97136.1 hypothetical protein LKACC16343_02146 [Companilactobacillus bobalius]